MGVRCLFTLGNLARTYTCNLFVVVSELAFTAPCRQLDKRTMQVTESVKFYEEIQRENLIMDSSQVSIIEALTKHSS